MAELFSSLGIDYRTLIFQSINFFLIFFIIYKFFAQPLDKLIQERRKKIEEGLRMREEAEKLMKEVRELRNKILQEAENQRLEILKRTEEEKLQLLDNIKEEINNKKTEMLKRLFEEEMLLREKLTAELAQEGKVILLELTKKIFHRADLDKDFLERLLK